MIPAIAAIGLQVASALKPHSPSTTPFSPAAPKEASHQGGGSIASDIGRLTTDALGLLGLGGRTSDNAGRGLRAYGAAPGSSGE